MIITWETITYVYLEKSCAVGRGGGVAVLHRSDTLQVTFFDGIVCTISVPQPLLMVYRPPKTSTVFLSELADSLTLHSPRGRHSDAETLVNTHSIAGSLYMECVTFFILIVYSLTLHTINSELVPNICLFIASCHTIARGL